MKTKGRRQSTNINDARTPEGKAKQTIRHYHTYDAVGDSLLSKKIQENIRQSIQTTPEDAVKKTHERAYGR